MLHVPERQENTVFNGPATPSEDLYFTYQTSTYAAAQLCVPQVAFFVCVFVSFILFVEGFPANFNHLPSTHAHSGCINNLRVPVLLVRFVYCLYCIICAGACVVSSPQPDSGPPSIPPTVHTPPPGFEAPTYAATHSAGTYQGSYAPIRDHRAHSLAPNRLLR